MAKKRTDLKIHYGIMDFRRLRMEGYYYVDKTEYLAQMEARDRFIFFVRPRRFGKSLFISMMESYYDRNQGLKVLKALVRAGLLQLLSSDKLALKDMSRPDKICLDNTCLMHALSREVDVGCARETFLLKQLRSAEHEVAYPLQGDFLVDGRYLFEVGGAGKGFSQIKDVPDSFVAADDIETGYGNKIPLWLFGFLY